MKKTLSFLAVVVVVGLLIYFFLQGKKTEYVAPEQNNSNASQQVNPVKTMPAGVKGEFGEGEMPAESAQPEIPKTISGRYYYSEDAKSQFAGKICFEPSTAVTGIGKRFCLTNADEAFAIIGIAKGFSDGAVECTVNAPATIEITSYTKLTGDAGGYDSAILKKVLNTGTQSFLACGKY